MKSLAPRNSLRWIAIIPLGLLLTLSAQASEKVLKDSFLSRGKSRTVYLFVPDSITSAQPAPLIVLLHGSGHNGLSLVDKWKDLASREGFIIAGPDSADPSVWSPTADGPDVLRDLVEQLKAKYPINQRRIYLFGHSGGAVYALTVSMLESEYFAATAVHAGAWRQTNEFKLIDVAQRKIPIAIWVGTIDPFFPLKAVHATRDALQAQGFPIEVNEMAGHDHWYYDLAPKINQNAWEFLKKYELPSEQRYAAYGEQADTAQANRMIQKIDALRKQAFDLSKQAEDSDAKLLAANLSTERSEIIRMAQNEVDLLKQSSAFGWRPQTRPIKRSS
jgi:predicted esterase